MPNGALSKTSLVWCGYLPVHWSSMHSKRWMDDSFVPLT